MICLYMNIQVKNGNGETSCANTYGVGYWFAPCNTYDWRCENCWPCKTSCFYQAVYIVCTDNEGNQWWLQRCITGFCDGYSPLSNYQLKQGDGK